MKEKLTINLKNYSLTCGDGCCTECGTITEINGEVLPNCNTDTMSILEQILTHLGYDVEITEEFDCE
jgi:ABC-type proline/glycine betaine transport system substrate-binding protein